MSVEWLWVNGKGHSEGLAFFLLSYKAADIERPGSVDLKNIFTGFVLWVGIK